MSQYKTVKVNRFEVNEEEVKEVLEKLKPVKSAGLDGLKAELYKELTNDRRAMEKLTSYKRFERRDKNQQNGRNKNNYDIKKE